MSVAHPEPSALSINQDLRQAQLNDKQIAPVIKWKEQSTTSPSWEEVAPHNEVTKVYWAQWQSLQMHNGVLYRLWESPAGDSTLKQIVLPSTLRNGVLQCLHGTPSAGHFGVAKTLGRIKETFYWVQCQKDVEKYIQNCDICAQKGGPPKRVRAPLGKYLTGSPAERLAVDMLGPLPTTERGNKYILIIADYFTKWTEVFPIPNQEATTVADILVKEHICWYGVSMILHSDQG